MLSLVTKVLLTLATGVWPLQPQPPVEHEFDPPSAKWGAGHRGVDLLGSVGQPVHATLPGTVRFVGRIAGRGVVVVDHGATRTTYEPVEAAVSPGDPVAGGQVLGSLAWFGSHCLPRACLHWGLIEGAETYLDPLSLIGCGPRPVRLLPLFREVEPEPGCEPPAATPGQVLAQAALTLVGALAGRPGAVGRW